MMLNGGILLFGCFSSLPGAHVQARTGDPNAFTRATVALALKFALLDSPAGDGPAAEAWNASITAETVAPFLMLIRDADRVRVALLRSHQGAGRTRPTGQGSRRETDAVAAPPLLSFVW